MTSTLNWWILSTGIFENNKDVFLNSIYIQFSFPPFFFLYYNRTFVLCKHFYCTFFLIQAFLKKIICSISWSNVNIDLSDQPFYRKETFLIFWTLTSVSFMTGIRSKFLLACSIIPYISDRRESGVGVDQLNEAKMVPWMKSVPLLLFPACLFLKDYLTTDPLKKSRKQWWKTTFTRSGRGASPGPEVSIPHSWWLIFCTFFPYSVALLPVLDTSWILTTWWNWFADCFR